MHTFIAINSWVSMHRLSHFLHQFSCKNLFSMSPLCQFQLIRCTKQSFVWGAETDISHYQHVQRPMLLIKFLISPAYRFSSFDHHKYPEKYIIYNSSPLLLKMPGIEKVIFVQCYEIHVLCFLFVYWILPIFCGKSNYVKMTAMIEITVSDNWHR